MTLPVTILHEAEVELWEAVAYYEDKTDGLGLDFATEIERAIRTIQQAPERWPLRGDGTRRLLADRFPYIVVYMITDNHVWIIASAHCKRRPEYWSSRI